VGKIAKKSLKERIFVNSALKMQCHVVKNTDCIFGDFAHWVRCLNLLTLYKKIAKKRFVKHHKIIFLTLLFMPYVLPYYVFPYYVFIKKSIKMYKLNKELFIETRKKPACAHIM